MEVEYSSFIDRVIVGISKIFNADFRAKFKELKKSDETYVFNKNNDGNNSFSTDGNKLYINYSKTKEMKDGGYGTFSLLRHETEHAVQFEFGEIGFENKDMGWGTVDAYNNYFEHRVWSAVNYDIGDELKAQDVGALGIVKGGSDRHRWFTNPDGTSVPESTRRKRLQNTPAYQSLPSGPQNNTNTEKVKNFYQYALPCRPRN
jgi:hypothetical protein